MGEESSLSESRVPQALVAASGALLFVVILEALGRFRYIESLTGVDPIIFTGEYLVGVATSLPFVIGVGYAGYWLTKSSISPRRYRRVGIWGVAGLVASLVINGAMIVVFTVDATWLLVGWLRWAVAIGLGIGVAIGISEARAVDSAIEAERAELQAEHLEAQRDLLEYLNSLLRHEVLNSVNVISGYASLLQEEHPSESRSHEYGETIQEQSQDMSQVIQDVRVLLDATHGTATFDPVNLSEILREEVKKADRTYDTAEIDASIPDDVFVPADRLLRRVFGNLLSNAVEHNDSEIPVVTVTVTTTSETVRIEIADNGSGIPDTAAETLFTRPETGQPDHGVGLYLVGKLVENYRGRIELTASDSNGSVFTVELPRVSPENPGSGEGVPTAFTLTDAEQP